MDFCSDDRFHASTVSSSPNTTHVVVEEDKATHWKCVLVVVVLTVVCAVLFCGVMFLLVKLRNVTANVPAPSTVYSGPLTLQTTMTTFSTVSVADDII